MLLRSSEIRPTIRRPCHNSVRDSRQSVRLPVKILLLSLGVKSVMKPGPTVIVSNFFTSLADLKRNKVGPAGGEGTVMECSGNSRVE